MRNYDPERACPKCGGVDLSEEWFPAGRGSVLERWDTYRDKPERIKRHCRRCHYEWDEAPLDGASDAGADKGVRDGA
jgi:ribosomal protein S27AE